MSVASDFISALQAGHQVRQQKEQHERQNEEDKLRAMLIKQQLEKIKTDAAVREYELKTAHAENMLKAQQGQPARQQADQPSTSLAGMLSGPMASPQAPEAAPDFVGPMPPAAAQPAFTAAPGAQPLNGTHALANEPVQFPGLPASIGGGSPGYEQTGQTIEDMLAMTRRAALEKELNTGVTLNPGDVRTIGGRVIARGDAKPEPTNTSEFGQFQESYAQSLGASSFKNLSPEQKMAAFPAYTKARQDPEAMAAVQAQREATLEATRARTEAARIAALSLPPAQQRRVDGKSRTFESLATVKNTQKMSEAVNFANSLDVNTKNPADDQALIYAFAKAMDPDSVVREGEYATVQKYAQSWAEKLGFDAKRIFSNTTFLTPQARTNMKQTIGTKFDAARQQYDTVRKSYAKQINQITGKDDGDTFLTDYGSAFPGAGGGAADGPVEEYALVNGKLVRKK